MTGLHRINFHGRRDVVPVQEEVDRHEDDESYVCSKE